VQVAIDRFLLAATERTSAPDALVDAVVSLDALFGSPAEAGFASAARSRGSVSRTPPKHARSPSSP
jgi:hypothetical protein